MRTANATIEGDRAFASGPRLARSLIRLMATPDDVTGPINLGTEHEMTMLDLAEMVIELTGSRSPIERRPLPVDDPKQRRPDLARARAELGWAPSTAPREGLARTVAWFDLALSEAGGKP